LSLEKIESVIGKVTVQLNTSSNPLAPGQLKSHYAPKKKLKLGNLAELVHTYRKQQVGVLVFQEQQPDIDPHFQIILSPEGNLVQAAQRLFASLRTLDKMDIDLILAEEVPDVGLGKAINDRLRRAAAD
jgi:L-threonylcarbamoyladenylate synthase